MAEIWGAAIVAGAAIYGSQQQKKGAAKAADANYASIAEQQRQFDINQANQQPFLDAGHRALELQAQFLAGDRSGFENSADYTFRRDQALQSQERGAAARGGFMGGGADADRIALASGLAGQAANDYWLKLAGQAGQGQGTAQSLGAAGQANANNIGGYLNNIANANASSYAANAQTAAAIGGAFNNWYQGNSARNNGGTGWYLGNQPGKG